MPGWLQDPDGSDQGLEDWCYRVLVSWLLRGNLYGDVLERGPAQMLKQVDIFHPDRVHPLIEDGEVKWLHQGREVPTNRMLHRRVNPVPGCLLGLSPVAYHAWTIGLNLTTTRFGLQWFQDGAHPGGVLRNTEVDLSKPGVAETAKDRFMAALRGSREPLVLGKGWEWQQIQLNPDESQFLETQGFTAAESARIFGPGIAEILGYGTKGSSLTYSNLIDRDLHVLKYALNKWLRRLERLLSMFLPRPQYVRLNRDALLETDTLRRYQAYAIALDKRFKVVNEIRDKEELPPVDWGDEPNPTPGAAPPQPDQPPEDGDEDDAEGGDQ
jgi:HK97 family phage portal protein